MALFKNSPHRGLFEFDESSMKASTIDRVSSLLSSLLAMAGLAVFMLGLLFFFRGGKHSEWETKPNIEKISSQGERSSWSLSP
jgi:hypothetical protein